MQVVQNTVDVVAAGVTLGVVVSFLPPLAAILTIIWTGLRIWGDPTVQALFKRKKDQDSADK